MQNIDTIAQTTGQTTSTINRLIGCIMATHGICDGAEVMETFDVVSIANLVFDAKGEQKVSDKEFFAAIEDARR